MARLPGMEARSRPRLASSEGLRPLARWRVSPNLRPGASAGELALGPANLEARLRPGGWPDDMGFPRQPEAILSRSAELSSVRLGEPRLKVAALAPQFLEALGRLLVLTQFCSIHGYQP